MLEAVVTETAETLLIAGFLVTLATNVHANTSGWLLGESTSTMKT